MAWDGMGDGGRVGLMALGVLFVFFGCGMGAEVMRKVGVNGLFEGWGAHYIGVYECVCGCVEMKGRW